MSAVPRVVRIVEVGPRDGLQNEAQIVPTGKKAEFIRLLAAAGLKDIEIASFVHPNWVPQLADAQRLLCKRGVGRHEARVADRRDSVMKPRANWQPRDGRAGVGRQPNCRPRD